MIVIRLSGGLGNQMFEYAVAKHLALRNRTVLKMDLVFLKRRSSSMRHTPRAYALGMFALEQRFFSPVERVLYKLKVLRMPTRLGQRLSCPRRRPARKGRCPLRR